ncbi:MAG TPA: molybdenum cofactor biosynthesis protein B [Planctomycetota bacterium]|nr:molybdenum cofactor biosynthesis protein B [Planctomycetota bacterium]
MGVEEHRQKAAETRKSLRCAVITVSDTRTLESDETGLEIARQLGEAGHEVLERLVVPDDPVRIAFVLRSWLAAEVDAVILNGGTGISSRDGTVEVVRQFLDMELPGFGEIFRMLSFEQIGAAAILSRAAGGIARQKAVFALPGSPRAAALGMEKLLVPELRHIVDEARKSS